MTIHSCAVLALGFALLLAGCAPARQAAPQTPPAPRIMISHWAARGCAGKHDMISFGSGAYINAYPGWPPDAEPDHIVIHYPNGDSIWGKPSYGAPDCPDNEHCQRATFIMNPTWKKCVPSGHLYEVVTLDGRPVLQSSLLQVIDPQTQRTVYLGFANRTWYAGPSVVAVAAQARQAAQHPPAAAPVASSSSSAGSALRTGAEALGTALGVTLAAALALGTVYLAARQQNLNYAAQTEQQNVNCSSTWVGSYWTTHCF